MHPLVAAQPLHVVAGDQAAHAVADHVDPLVAGLGHELPRRARPAARRPPARPRSTGVVRCVDDPPEATPRSPRRSSVKMERLSTIPCTSRIGVPAASTSQMSRPRCTGGRRATLKPRPRPRAGRRPPGPTGRARRACRPTASPRPRPQTARGQQGGGAATRTHRRRPLAAPPPGSGRPRAPGRTVRRFRRLPAHWLLARAEGRRRGSACRAVDRSDRPGRSRGDTTGRRSPAGGRRQRRPRGAGTTLLPSVPRRRRLECLEVWNGQRPRPSRRRQARSRRSRPRRQGRGAGAARRRHGGRLHRPAPDPRADRRGRDRRRTPTRSGCPCSPART